MRSARKTFADTVSVLINFPACKNGRRGYAKGPSYGNPHRRDRNSSAVPPFLAGLSGSLTQPALCSPDIAGSAPHLSRGTPRPVPLSYPGGSQHTKLVSSFSVRTALMYYSSSSSRFSDNPKSILYLTRNSKICQPQIIRCSSD